MDFYILFLNYFHYLNAFTCQLRTFMVRAE